LRLADIPRLSSKATPQPVTAPTMFDIEGQVNIDAGGNQSAEICSEFKTASQQPPERETTIELSWKPAQGSGLGSSDTALPKQRLDGPQDVGGPDRKLHQEPRNGFSMRLRDEAARWNV